MSWTDERVQLLKVLWTQGLSASQIAARLGSVSRNAVIGKAHRLGLQGRPSPIRGTPGGGRKRVPAAKLRAVATALAVARREAEAARIPEPEPEPVLEEPAVRAAAAGANSRGPQCRWPIGDPDDPTFHFCEATAARGRPYCAGHCEIAYIRKDRSAA